MPGIGRRPSAPRIVALTPDAIGDPTCITNATYIDISTDTPQCRMFFTTDESIPDPLSTTPGRGVTFQYKGRFTLKPGERTIKAVALHKISSEVSKISMKTFVVQRMDDEELDDIEESSNLYSSEISHTDNDDVDSFDSELDYYFAQSSRPKYQMPSMRSSTFTPTMVDFGSDEDNYFLSRKDEYQDLPARLSHDSRFSQRYDSHYEPPVVWEGPKENEKRYDEKFEDVEESSEFLTDLDDIRSRYSNTSYRSQSPRPSLSTDVLLKTPRTYRKPDSPLLEPKKSDNLPLQKPSLSNRLSRFDPKKNEDELETRTDHSKQVLEDSKPTMKFVNKSGTQINFWGVENAERIIQELNLKSATPKKPTSNRLLSSKNDERSVRFEKVPEVKRSIAMNDPIQKEECHEQQLPSFLRKLFGLSDSEEDAEDDRKRRKKRKNDKKKQSKKRSNESEQNFKVLKNDCHKNNELWRDASFPPTADSLYHSGSGRHLEWKRPRELCRDPRFISEGVSRFDVKQGSLGDCWLLAALSSVANQRSLFDRVVPPNQNFHSNYSGIFRFNVWQYGKWVEICVDDKLPVYQNRLIYMHSSSEDEFWSALVEKAFAKIYGCYESLTGGQSSDAMTDLTGGVVERFNLKSKIPDDLFYIMFKSIEHGSLLGCSIDANPDVVEEKLENGLLKGHAYSITDVKQLESSDGNLNLVRIRNPWGNEFEWKGEWSDQSRQWNSIEPRQRQELGLTFEADGEFWMSYKDFISNFERLEICHWNIGDIMDTNEKMKWNSVSIHSAWKKGVSAGGCRNFKKTYHINPQFRIQVEDADDDDELGTIIVSLTQICNSKQSNETGGNITIGYEIFKAPDYCGTLKKDFFSNNRPVVTSSYINLRDVCQRHLLEPGEYIVIPSTFEPNQERKFLLRVFSEKPSSVKPSDMPTTSFSSPDVSGPLTAAVRRQAEAEFKKYAQDDDQIDAFELKKLLNKTFVKHKKMPDFDTEICKSLIALKDTDSNWTLNINEFQELWVLLDNWKTNFDKFDIDKSDYFDNYELREALQSSGYCLSNRVYEDIVKKFADEKGRIYFSSYAHCLIKLQIAFECFEANKNENDEPTMPLQEYVDLALST
ncbi:DgyrCDS9375 [Dimorphilus gyrociliatus]|uniref:DgyrCDS9375 n=1 Tax=Dimorphilus gyrociliatus TaxID=2664684 RepID=A0A7I8VY88_9ANNE|nr:DgyrCDS9375 [Dimorphilus gyrociliatus]